MSDIGKTIKVTEEPAPIKAPRILPRREAPERKKVDPFEPLYVPVPVRRESPKEIWDIVTSEEEPTNCPKCGDLLEDVKEFRKVIGLGCSRHGMVLRF